MLHLKLNDSHSAYNWLRSQADRVGAAGHIGTHIDCYTTIPAKSLYTVECMLVNYEDLSSIEFQSIDLRDRALVIYTGNVERNTYGSTEYNSKDTSVDIDLLRDILQAKPQFILIDSYGIGAHGKQHISHDILCEESGCFVVENVNLKKEVLSSIKVVKIEIDIDNISTGKPCCIVEI